MKSSELLGIRSKTAVGADSCVCPLLMSSDTGTRDQTRITRSHLGSPLKTFGAIIVLLLCFPACNEESHEDPCASAQKKEPSLPVILKLVADLSVNEISESDGKGQTTTVGMLSAFFADFSTYEEETVHVVAFGEACLGEVGKRTLAAKPEPLTAGEVLFKGLSINDVVLNKTDAGLFEPESIRGAIL